MPSVPLYCSFCTDLTKVPTQDALTNHNWKFPRTFTRTPREQGRKFHAISGCLSASPPQPTGTEKKNQEAFKKPHAPQKVPIFSESFPGIFREISSPSPCFPSRPRSSPLPPEFSPRCVVGNPWMPPCWSYPSQGSVRAL